MSCEHDRLELPTMRVNGTGSFVDVVVVVLVHNQRSTTLVGTCCHRRLYIRTIINDIDASIRNNAICLIDVMKWTIRCIVMNSEENVALLSLWFVYSRFCSCLSRLIVNMRCRRWHRQWHVYWCFRWCLWYVERVLCISTLINLIPINWWRNKWIRRLKKKYGRNWHDKQNRCAVCCKCCKRNAWSSLNKASCR
jgi:hypothetical protein